MHHEGKKNVLGVLVDEVDYEAAVSEILDAAEHDKPFAVTALAVHGVMTGRYDAYHRYRLNRLDLVCPDGQPVLWALNLLHRAKLVERCCGPTLTLRVCESAAKEGLSVYFYGSSEDVLEKLTANLSAKFPGLKIAGAEPSKFRQMNTEERQAVVDRIMASGAKILFVGLGCPRQEVFVYEFRDMLPMPMLAVGAAFDFHAGTKKQPAEWVQKAGLEWFYRLCQEPRRLFKRYATTNFAYVGYLTLQSLRLWRPDPADSNKPNGELLYG